MEPQSTKYAKHLIKNGYVVLPLSPQNAKTATDAYEEFLKSPLPEFSDKFNNDRAAGNTDQPLHSAGAFGASPLASSYHHPKPIKIDEIAFDAAWNVLCRVCLSFGLNYVSLIPDRMCYRTERQPRDSAHQDNTRGVLDASDKFYGGFINLNSPGEIDQFVTLVPGSHPSEPRFDGKDFTPPNKDSVKYWMGQMIDVKVPPGHMIIFAENIMHAVNGKKPGKIPIKRKFTAFLLRRTKHQWCTCFEKYASQERLNRRIQEGERHELCPIFKKQCDEQAPLTFKGGKVAPFYPALWWVNFREKLVEFSEYFFKERILVTREVKSGKCKGDRIVTVPEVPPSLQELGSKYPESNFDRFVPRAISLSNEEGLKTQDPAENQSSDLAVLIGRNLDINRSKSYRTEGDDDLSDDDMTLAEKRDRLRNKIKIIRSSANEAYGGGYLCAQSTMQSKGTE